MKTNQEFVNFLFEIVNPDKLIPGIYFCDQNVKIGSKPSCYLMGTTGQTVSSYLLNYCFKKYYSDMPTDEFEKITKDFIRNKCMAFDCQGVLDYFAGVDINTSMCYTSYCPIKDGDAYMMIAENPAKFAGAAFFKQNESGKIHHVGFLAGLSDDGDFLFIEAKGLKHGVIMSRYNPKEWQLVGIPSKLLKFENKRKITLTIDNKIVFDDFI